MKNSPAQEWAAPWRCQLTITLHCWWGWAVVEFTANYHIDCTIRDDFRVLVATPFISLCLNERYLAGVVFNTASEAAALELRRVTYKEGDPQVVI
jgi:hypothetical protein